MALQTIRHRVGTARVAGEPVDRDYWADWPAALPAGTLVAVFDGRLDAATALRELHDAGVVPARTWQASGLAGARRMRLASEARSPLARMVRALTDRGTMASELADWAATGHTVLAVQVADGTPAAVEPLTARASHVVRVGRWVTERVR